ncbi:hypothetical protein HMPREF9374_0391, partial [Desmospora sp. 8437]
TYGYTAYGKNDEKDFTGVDKPDPQTPDEEPYNVYRFNSKRWDAFTGEYDMGFRSYNPGLNRFLTRDMYNGALADMNLATDPWNMNRYAFAGGNPISGIEIDGHWFAEAGTRAKYVENPKTGWGRMSGNEAHPESNGKYKREKNELKQVSIEASTLIFHARHEMRSMNPIAIAKQLALDTGKWNIKNRFKGKIEYYGNILPGCGSFDEYEKNYKGNKPENCSARLGNMLVGAAGDQIGLTKEMTVQATGGFQGLFDLIKSQGIVIEKKAPFIVFSGNKEPMVYKPKGIADYLERGYRTFEDPMDSDDVELGYDSGTVPSPYMPRNINIYAP